MGATGRTGVTRAAGSARRPRSLRPAVLRVVLACVACAPIVLQAQPPAASPEIAVLWNWRRAIEAHAPGESDEAARHVAAWSPLQLEQTLFALDALVNDLRKNRPLARWASGPSESGDPIAWLGLSLDERRTADLTRIVKRGAVLHTDIAVLLEVTRPEPGQAPRSGRASSVAISDGQFEGYRLDSDHIGFARRLLDHVEPRPRDDDAVVAWYRAIGRHLAGRAALGELERHLAAGRQVLPRDAELTMLEGALHHALASPRVQVASSAIVMPPGLALSLGTPSAELASARRAYEEALRLDPHFAEARLGLGRTLADAGRAADAASSLQVAAAALEEPVMQYFATLFLGEQLMLLGRADEARASFERASTLFPRAQSPLLALSLLARSRGDRDDALAAIALMMRLPAARDARDDPWWAYHTSAGRQSAQRLDAASKALMGQGR